MAAERRRNTELREQLLETLYTESEPVTFDSLVQNVKAVAVLTAEPTEVSTKAQVCDEPTEVSTKA